MKSATYVPVRVLAVFAVIATSVAVVRAAGTTEIIYSFAGEVDGEYADTDLVIDSTGNLYGTTVLGGDFGGGTVWQLTSSDTGWIHTVLYSFTGGADGGEPYKGVTLDAQGNLYGTAVTGGTGGCEGGCGVAYKLTHSGGNWNFTVIHTFTGGTDGSSGSAGRLLLHAGRLYGVATTGGANGKGTAYELKPSHAGEWTLKTIYAFQGQPDAGFPYGGLLLGTSGKLYGTTYYDGANNLGSVYELSRTAMGGWKERVLYSFQGGSDGQNSLSNLVIDAAGNLYGTTSEGGASCSCGTIFKLTPGPNGIWTESVAHRFQGPPDGAFPYNGMVTGAAGNFYGATVHGGVAA